MIELTGTPDYAGELRKLTGGRGNIRPVMNEAIAPVVDVGPQLIHVYALPRITASFRDLFPSGSNAVALRNNTTDRVFVLSSGEYTWAPGTSTPFVVVQRYLSSPATPVVSPTNVLRSLNNQTGQGSALIQVDAAGVSTLQFELGYSRDLQRDFSGDGLDALWPGNALVITWDHADVGNRLFGARCSFLQYAFTS